MEHRFADNVTALYCDMCRGCIECTDSYKIWYERDGLKLIIKPKGIKYSHHFPPGYNELTSELVKQLQYDTSVGKKMMDDFFNELSATIALAQHIDHPSFCKECMEKLEAEGWYICECGCGG